MDRKQKIWRLRHYCANTKCSKDSCSCYFACQTIDKPFAQMEDTEINKCYKAVFETKE